MTVDALVHTEQLNQIHPRHDSRHLVVRVGDDEPLDGVSVHEVDGSLERIFLAHRHRLRSHDVVDDRAQDLRGRNWSEPFLSRNLCGIYRRAPDRTS